MRRKYVMRAVVKRHEAVSIRAYHVNEIGTKTHWRNGEPCRMVEKDELSCGHLRLPEVVDSLSDALRIGFRTIDGRTVKRRCYDCAKTGEK